MSHYAAIPPEREIAYLTNAEHAMNSATNKVVGDLGQRMLSQMVEHCKTRGLEWKGRDKSETHSTATLC